VGKAALDQVLTSGGMKKETKRLVPKRGETVSGEKEEGDQSEDDVS